MKLLDAELLETREFLPGQWLQTLSTRRGSPRAPGRASSSTSGRPTTRGLVLRRPFSINTVDRDLGRGHHPLPGDRQGHRLAGPHAAGRQRRRCSARWAGRSRSTRGAATCCSSPAAWAWPACGARGRRARRRAARWRCCSAPRPRRRSIPRRCCPTRSSTSSPPMTAASATTAG